MTEYKKYDVFISYSRKDFNEVEIFKVMLQNCISGLRCWFDLTGIESGEDFSEKIVSAINNSAYVLFMVSDNSMVSEWTKKEVTYAKNTGKRVIPILLKGSRIKGWFLFEYGLVDSIDSTDSRQVDKLVNNLSTWTNKEAVGRNTHKEDNETAESFTIDQANQLYDNEQYVEAFNLYSILAKQGDSAAQCMLGDFYFYGHGIHQDYTQAIYWYNKTAEQGNADAQYSLGMCYFYGHGVQQDDKQAVNWYQKSAEQGNPFAQNDLGECYDMGMGVQQDYTQAVYWYRKSAEQGNADAQYNLGYCYEFGEGVKQDYAQAVYWYRKATGQGNEEAIKALKELSDRYGL